MLNTRTLVGALAFAVGLASQAQTKWDMPTPYADGEFHTRNVRAFVEEVQKSSAGKLQIQVHSNGSLIKHPDILRAVSTGQVNIAEFLLSQFGNEDAIFEADNIPFVAAGFDQAMITSSATGTSTKAWEFVKNYYNTSAFHPKNAVVVNTRSLSRLSKDEQQALRTSAATAEKRGWDMAKEREKEANEMLAKNGMTIHQPDAAMKDAYAKVGDQILAEWLKKAGPEGEQLIKSYRAGK